jgi:hypothetical protein
MLTTAGGFERRRSGVGVGGSNDGFGFGGVPGLPAQGRRPCLALDLVFN